MVPINVPLEKIEILANTFGCQIRAIPFTYLGLPMGTTKPRMKEFTPLMDRIERRLTTCSSLLSYSGRLEMVNSVISPTVTYALCTLKLPKGVLDNIDRARKQCLWRGNDNSKKGGNLVAWPTVMMPKLKGGLGVITLRLQNDALLLKHLHKFYSKEDTPWVALIWNRYYGNKVPHAAREVGSFWWKDILRLSTLYRGIASCSLGDGSTVLFWDDLWAHRVLSQDFPRLFSFAKNARASVKLLMSQTSLDDIFNLPLSPQAHDEFLELQDWLQHINYDPIAVDVWTFQWGNSKYSSRKFYQLAFQQLEAHPIFSWLWKSGCTPRVKFFGWLIMVDRLNTKTMLRRRNLNVDDNDTVCILCAGNCEEDIDHLFFDCEFAKRCWTTIGIQYI
jgi:hypothetical protein